MPRKEVGAAVIENYRRRADEERPGYKPIGHPELT